MKKLSVLQDHKRNGKNFIPPLMQIGNIQTTSYSNQHLPQLIWLDIITWKTSFETSLIILEILSRFFSQLNEFSFWGTFISNYENLNELEVKNINEYLNKEGVLDVLKSVFHDFHILYPLCPLARIFPSNGLQFKDPLFIENFKERLSILFDRRSRNAILMQSHVILMGNYLNRLSIDCKIRTLDNFPEISNYPNMENPEKMASGICSLLNGIAPMQLPLYPEDIWSNYFWKRGLEIEPINFSYLETL